MCLIVFIMYLYFSKSSAGECKGLRITESILKINFLNSQSRYMFWILKESSPTHAGTDI